MTYQHIILSPHFDDAALSLGGMIASLTDRGETVLVITLCSAPPHEPLNAFAQYLHEQWGNTDDPIAVRQAEDQAAVTRMGADLLFLGDWDAIYRHPAYNSVQAIFAQPVNDDPMRERLTHHLTALDRAYSAAQWYAPLAIGNHVDHQLTHDVARAVLPRDRVLWYEDLPYATNHAVRDQRLVEFPNAESILIDISDTLELKLAAVADYASQIGELFGDLATMRQRLTNYAASLSQDGRYLERLWRIDD